VDLHLVHRGTQAEIWLGVRAVETGQSLREVNEKMFNPVEKILGRKIDVSKNSEGTNCPHCGKFLSTHTVSSSQGLYTGRCANKNCKYLKEHGTPYMWFS